MNAPRANHSIIIAHANPRRYIMHLSTRAFQLVPSTFDSHIQHLADALCATELAAIVYLYIHTHSRSVTNRESASDRADCIPYGATTKT